MRRGVVALASVLPGLTMAQPDAQAGGAGAAGRTGRCIDLQVVATPASAASAVPVRLSGVRYSCMVMRDGQSLLVGQAGPPPGERPVVLLVHGLGSNGHRDWAWTLPALASPESAMAFHVVTVDLPGFGASPAPRQAYEFATVADQLAQVLERVAPGQRAHVVGHSLGGAMSLYFAHRRPDKVDRLVLVDAAGILLRNVFVQHIASLRPTVFNIRPLDRLLGVVGDALNGLSRQMILGLDDRYDITPWLARNPDVRRALIGERTQVDAALHLVDNDFSNAIRNTAAPTTLIWGRNDGIAPLRTGTLLAARMPDARLHVIDGAGHTPMADAPAEFNRRLLAALTEPLGTSGREAMPSEAGASQGDVTCNATDRARYSGRFDSLTLVGCTRVRIEDARIGRLVIDASSANIERSVIDGNDVAVAATNSDLSATAITVRGRVGIRTDNSIIDLAGGSLQARERGVEATGRPSRVFFSVSDWQGSDYTGDAHFTWPRPGMAP